MSRKFRYILSAYLLGILYFTLFRIVGTFVFFAGSESAPDFQGLYPQALFMGWRFDTVVSCYILAIPILCFLAGAFLHIRSKAYYNVFHYLIGICYTLCLFACAADIPYFSYFFTRLNAMALNYGDSASVVIDMIVSEPTYIVYFFVFVVVAISYWLLLSLCKRRWLIPEDRPTPWYCTAIVGVLFIFGCFTGMRGRLNKKAPIRVGTAYFCNNAFLNQIGLNPAFTFVKSALELAKDKNKPLELIDIDTAQEIANNARATDTLASFIPELPKNTNVVLIIMESMATEKMGFFEGSYRNDSGGSLTPHLDSIMAHSLCFTNTYSAGIHTYNGVYGTLYSHPALLAQHAMKRIPMPLMGGLPWELFNNGYHTRFYITHDEGFDNMGGFLKGNGFETVISQKDYPSHQIVGTWGVPDHVLFDHAIEDLNKQDKTHPFFATMLTCSDHAPYVLPEDVSIDFQSEDMGRRMVEYADWAIAQFMQKASETEWFKNTIFVFIADHGAGFASPYDMTLAYHHIPMFFYCPNHIQPSTSDQLALQIDLAPTLLSLLTPQYRNNTLGINLFRQQRPYAYFSADDRIGVLDGEYFYLYRANEKHASLYHYQDNDPTDYLSTNSPRQDELLQRADSMKRYAFSMIQYSQYLLQQNKTH